jgi:hypothetical protein
MARAHLVNCENEALMADTPLFDTLAFSRRLRAAGMDVELADALTFAMSDLFAGKFSGGIPFVVPDRQSSEFFGRLNWLS